ncbi:MAG: tyrosine-type recombinase/integrase [Phycisphaera sp.]|nr:tyrosine-type recombinase/integrase [Phycisphaera sp.]
MAGWRAFKKQKNRSRYTIAGKDHLGVVRQMPAFTQEGLSRELARNVATLVEHKRNNWTLPPHLAIWAQGLAPDIRNRLTDFGLLDGQSKPIAGHLADFEATLKAKGNTGNYVMQTLFRIRTIVDGCQFKHWSDVQASKVQRFIAELMASKTKPATAQTQNYYLRDFKGFVRWAVRDGRLAQSPVEHLRPLSAAKVRGDRRHERRALTVEDATRLLTTTKAEPERFGMTGIERAMLYHLAIETGLRAGELCSLTRQSFDLHGYEPTVTVHAAYTKNGDRATLPLRSETVEELRVVLAGKAPQTRAFAMPRRHLVIAMLRADLAAAGIPYRLDEKHGKVIDFHSLRHTCGSWLAAAGVHPKVIQKIMRHSTITLTMDRYAHAFQSDEVAAIAKLPTLTPPNATVHAVAQTA